MYTLSTRVSDMTSHRIHRMPLLFNTVFLYAVLYSWNIVAAQAYEFTCQPLPDESGHVKCTVILPTQQDASKLQYMTACTDRHCVNGIFTVSVKSGEPTGDNEPQATQQSTTDTETMETVDDASHSASTTDSTVTAVTDTPSSLPKSESSSSSDDASTDTVHGISYFWNQYYPRPYSRYPAQIAQILRERPHHDDHELEHLDWLVQLSLAHEQVLEESLSDSINSPSSSSSSFKSRFTASTDTAASDPTVQSHLQSTLKPLEQADQIIHRYQSSSSSLPPGYTKDTLHEYQALISYYRAYAYEAVSDTSRALIHYAHANDLYKQQLQSKLDERSKDETTNSKSKQKNDDEEEENENTDTLFLNWAMCGIRIGTYWLEMAQSPSAMDTDMMLTTTTNPMPTLDTATTASSLQQLQHLLQAQKVHLQRRIDPAMESFQQADTILRAMARRPPHSAVLLSSWQREWANTLHSMSTAAILLQDYPQACQYGREALQLYQSILATLRKQAVSETPIDNGQDMYQDMGDLLYSLADASLQQGRSTQYDDAISYYQQAMQMYQEHHLTIEGTLGDANNIYGDDDSDSYEDSIESYESALQEYSELFAEGITSTEGHAGLNAEINEDGAYYEKSDLYEGDLHAGLGGLYLSKGDIMMASSHLQQALQLYAAGGEADAKHSADVHLNMAMLYFRNGDYQQSSQSYIKAVNIYRDTVEEGQSPTSIDSSMGDMATLLGQMDELNGMGGDLLDMVTPKPRKRKHEHRKVTTRKVAMDDESRNDRTESGSNNDDDDDDDSLLIDYDEYRHSVVNETTPTIKSEL
jgi:tetratricopeptide (TPR) repeat protein